MATVGISCKHMSCFIYKPEHRTEVCSRGALNGADVLHSIQSFEKTVQRENLND